MVALEVEEWIVIALVMGFRVILTVPELLEARPVV